MSEAESRVRVLEGLIIYRPAGFLHASLALFGILLNVFAFEAVFIAARWFLSASPEFGVGAAGGI